MLPFYIKGRGYYIVAGGASAYQTISHIKESIRDKNFNVALTDVTAEMGVLSIQGPNSRKILQNITKFDLSNENLPVNSAAIAAININGRGKSIYFIFF